LEHKLCVLIDFENLAAGTEKEGLGRFDVRAVFRRLKDKGRILVARSYGDWGRFARFKQKLLEEGVTMVELTSYRGAEKNRADIALVVDAMEIAYTRPHVDTFVLLSGDSDFTPLVMRLKELDKRVIGIGTRGSTSRLLVECCDEFMFYDSLRKAAAVEVPEEEDEEELSPRSTRPATTMSRDVAFALLVETIAGIQKDEPGPVHGGIIKQGILRKAPAFDENELGFSGFARFLEVAQDKGLVRLIRDEKAGGYRVEQPGAPELPRPRAAVVEEAPAAEEEDVQHGPLLELDGEADRLQGVLIAAGVFPVGHMARHTVVHEFVDHVIERQQRKKRNTLTYVYGDIARRCRKTDPVVPSRVVRAVINALKYAGELVHTSGEPVRSNTAHFVLQRDAEDLLKSIRTLYVQILLDKGERLTDGHALSSLLWNDDQHVVEAGELVAFTQRQRELGLLRASSVGEAAPEEAVAEAEPSDSGRGRRRRSDRPDRPDRSDRTERNDRSERADRRGRSEPRGPDTAGPSGGSAVEPSGPAPSEATTEVLAAPDVDPAPAASGEASPAAQEPAADPDAAAPTRSRRRRSGEPKAETTPEAKPSAAKPSAAKGDADKAASEAKPAPRRRRSSGKKSEG
jgi:uncharacterized protein (TIGR00288 family)